MTILAIEQLVSILPECLLIIAALMSLVLGAIRGRQSFEMQLYLSMAVITIAAVVEFNFLHVSTTILNHMLIINPFITASKLFLLVVGVVVVWMSFAYYRDHKEYAVSEYPVLILLSLAGTMFMVSANHMLSFFISLELQGIAGYLLAAWHRDETKSSEAGLKYFILGSLASGLLLFGISFIYGFTSTLGVIIAEKNKLPSCEIQMRRSLPLPASCDFAHSTILSFNGPFGSFITSRLASSFVLSTTSSY